MSDPDAISPGRRAWRRFCRNRAALTAALCLTLWTIVVSAWPLFSLPRAAAFLPSGMTHAPDTVSDAPFAPPGALHWMGADEHGRDLLSRICAGTRVSLAAAAAGAVLALMAGVFWGAAAGWLGGRADAALMRTADIFYSIPSVLLVLVLVTALDAGASRWRSGPGADWTRLAGLLAGLGVAAWPVMARVVRAQVRSLKAAEFVLAARALGAGPGRIVFRHILPNAWGVVIVYLTTVVPSVVVNESFLSWLGLGVQPPRASLGTLLAGGAEQINPVRVHWWLVAWPGAVLCLTLLALNLVGGGLRDAWDSRESE